MKSVRPLPINPDSATPPEARRVVGAAATADMLAALREMAPILDDGRLTDSQRTAIVRVVQEAVAQANATESGIVDLPASDSHPGVDDPTGALAPTTAAGPPEVAQRRKALQVIPTRDPLSGEENISSDPTSRSVDFEARYEDLGLIAQGGMGEVRRVRDKQLQRVVAMKIIKAGLATKRELVKAFVREATVTSYLDHAAIVPVHEFGWFKDGRAYFTMKQIRGEMLRDVVRRHVAGRSIDGQPPAWPLDVAMEAFASICEAVGFGHQKGFVHRDLKPENILVNDKGAVTVLDWGLAEPIPGFGEGSIVLTAVSLGGAVGTPPYMSPEQASDTPDALFPASDVYALGQILAYVVTGKAPFEGVDYGSILRRLIIEGPPELPARPLSVDEKLWAVVQKATAKKSVERYANALELAAAVRGWLQEVRGPSLDLSMSVDPALVGAPANRSAARILVGVVAVVACLAGLAYFSAESRGGPDAPRAKEISAVEPLAPSAPAAAPRQVAPTAALVPAAAPIDIVAPVVEVQPQSTAIQQAPTSRLRSARRVVTPVETAPTPTEPVRPPPTEGGVSGVPDIRRRF